jgi:hypothetical protein
MTEKKQFFAENISAETEMKYQDRVDEHDFFESVFHIVERDLSLSFDLTEEIDVTIKNNMNIITQIIHIALELTCNRYYHTDF